MYPFARVFKELFINRNAARLGPTDTHVSHHICWPWDLDILAELNNGRTLSLYDLGRLPLAQRTGMLDVLRRKGWGLTMAGATVRYRRRVRAFDRIEMHSRVVGVDEKFVYLEQSMWVKGQAASHVLYRAAVTDKSGIVPTAMLIAEFGVGEELENLPGWVTAWIKAEALRPWPPHKQG